jgi:hypothetical protein
MQTYDRSASRLPMRFVGGLRDSQHLEVSMILVAGIPSESPLSSVIEALCDRHADVVVLNQRQFADMTFEWTLSEHGVPDGLLRIGRRHWWLRDIAGVYARLIQVESLPEYVAADQVTQQRGRAFHDSLISWLDIAPCRVINRHCSMASNSSKPYQSQLIAKFGFAIPETLITNDPVAVREFAGLGPAIFKSASGARSIVKRIGADDLERLDNIRVCPVQFQRLVEGTDVRVHVVGKEVFATRITSEATDYRYAAQQVQVPAQLEAIELSGDLAGRCVALSQSLQLEFTGIDLSFGDDGKVYCFEVNPSPGYSYFEANTGQPIADAVARLLMS